MKRVISTCETLEFGKYKFQEVPTLLINNNCYSNTNRNKYQIFIKTIIAKDKVKNYFRYVMINADNKLTGGSKYL